MAQSSSSKRLQLGILISGRGSNMAAIIDAIASGRLDAQAAVVISDKPQAEGLKIAAAHKIPTQVFQLKSFETKDAFEQAILKALTAHQVDLVVLAGYMKLVGNTLLNAYCNRMMNIHPSLLPAFKGMDAQRQAIESRATKSGCTVHFVTAALDGGPIILQQAVPVTAEDTVASLSQKILKYEHQLYPEAIQLYAQGRLAVNGDKVVIQ